MTNPQGTDWETYLTHLGPVSDRITKRGIEGEPDVWWFNHPASVPPAHIIPAVVWKRLVPVKGKKRRRPDGERDVVVLRLSDFEDIMEALHAGNPDISVAIQAKWTQRLNVTRTLHSLTQAIKQMYDAS